MAAEQVQRTAKEELIQLILDSDAEDLKRIAAALEAFMDGQENGNE